jgi:multidrug efflux system membrane fusion protein
VAANTTGTLWFRAKIDNPADRNGNRFIIPGLMVKVRLQIGEPHPAILVRERALVKDQDRKTVWVVKGKKDKQGHPILTEKGEPVYEPTQRDVGTLGVLLRLKGVEYREVEKGVEPGDWVVVSGMQRLRPGIEVKVQKFASEAKG